MKDSEENVRCDYLDFKIEWEEALERLIKIGYSESKAEDIAFEWVGIE